MVKQNPKIFDISPEISSETAVFPGDEPFERLIKMDFSKGDNLVLSAIHTTVHIGAHTDSPGHYHPDGVSIERRSLHHYIGDCQVITVDLPRGERILPVHFQHVTIQAKRVLFHTGSFPDPNRWNGDFNSLSPETVNFLAGQGVVLVGLDTPSVDPCEDKLLESHQAIHQKDMAILEGVVLNQVADGLYTLVALPLKLKDADASPVRAILLR